MKIKISAWMYILLPLAVLFGGVTLIAVYLAAICFHELSHVLAARLRGFAVDRIVIMPLGAYADIAGLDEADPASEFIIAIAGPCGSIFLLITALAAGRYFKSPELELFAQVNMLMAGFNLLPGLPLDGGRCLRALLRTFMSRGRATFVSAAFGCGLGALFTAAGIYIAWHGDIRPSALSIGIFLMISSINASRSPAFSLYSAIHRRERQLGERRVMDVRHMAAHASTDITSVVTRFSPNRYHIVTVTGNGFSRTVTEEQLLNAIMRGARGEIGECFRLL